MGGSYGAGFDGSTRGYGGGHASTAVWDAVDQLRTAFTHRPGGSTRMGRGDVRAAVIALLTERPMHGYQIIHEIEERSGGAWKPSAGSVYPTLQLLADEGLIVAEEQGGRKTYSLTEAGSDLAGESAEQPAPWEGPGSRAASQFGALPKAGVDLAGAAAQVGRTGSPEQVQEAVKVLHEARRKLYAILAEA